MSSDKSPNALRTIGEVAEDIGVATHVLRFWENKFHQIKPQKRRGRRYYRPEDIVIIKQIQELLYNEGYTIRGVQKFLANKAKNKKSGGDNVQPIAQQQAPQQQPQAQSAPLAALNPNYNQFETDLFGNIIKRAAGVAQPQAQNEQEPRFSDSKIQELRKIYNGLKEARAKLEDLDHEENLENVA